MADFGVVMLSDPGESDLSVGTSGLTNNLAGQPGPCPKTGGPICLCASKVVPDENTQADIDATDSDAVVPGDNATSLIAAENVQVPDDKPSEMPDTKDMSETPTEDIAEQPAEQDQRSDGLAVKAVSESTASDNTVDDPLQIALPEFPRKLNERSSVAEVPEPSVSPPAAAQAAHEHEAAHDHSHLSGDHAEHMAALELVKTADATHIAIRDGDWFDPDTWASGEVPGDDARAVIPDGISVTYSGQSDARIFTIGVEGELRFDPDTDSRLVVDTLVVAPSGRFEIGTADKPVTADIDIIIANNGNIDTDWDGQLLSRGIVSLGESELHGTEKDSHTKVLTDPLAGDTDIVLAGGGEGWEVGDTIVIAGTQNKLHFGIGPNRSYQGTTDEVRVITAIDGDRISLDQPLDFDHISPRADLKTSVANYSRSITIRSEDGADSAVHERGHVAFMGSDDVDVRYVAFDHLGRTDKSERSAPADTFDDIAFNSNVQGRYSLHLHRLGLEDQRDPVIIEGNAVTGSPGWGIAHHSSNANLHNNATFDIFGAAYVAEQGDETGTWSDNISIKTEGLFRLERNHRDVDAFDLGRTGNGFWFQSRLVESHDNIAAGARTGFVWLSQGATDFDANLFDLPDAIGTERPAEGREVTINNFLNNETFGSERGLMLTKGNPRQDNDLHSVLDGFTGWEVREGVFVQYSAHYTFTNFDLVASEHDDRNAHVRYGFRNGNNATDVVVNDSKIDGFTNAYDFSGFFSNGAPQSQKQFVVIGGQLSNLRESVFLQDDYEVRTQVLDVNEVAPREQILNVVTSVVGGPELNSPGSLVTGTKIDSVGETVIPAGQDKITILPEQIATVLKTDGYYERDGKHVVVFEMYYQDRLTGEILKVGHLLEAADLTTFSRGHFAGSIFRGAFPEDNAPVEVTGEIAETSPETPTIIDILSNDFDPDGDPIRLDGIIQPARGRVFDNKDGTVTYVPDIDFTGEDRFGYWVTDGLGEFVKAEVVVTVAEPAPPGDPDPGPSNGDDHDDGTQGDGSGDNGDDGGSDTGGDGDGAGGGGTSDPDEDTESNGDQTPEVDANSDVTDSGPTGSHDRLNGTALADQIDGAGGNDTIYGDDGDDHLYGGTGADELRGGPGADRLDGGDGNDLVLGQGDADRLAGGSGADTLKGGGGADKLLGQGGDDKLVGGGGDDILKGQGDDDRLLGRGGDDVLRGGSGDDRLLGNKGDDTLKGNGGSDIFSFKRNDGADVVRDFQQGRDLIEIRNGADSFADLNISSVGNDAVIRFAGTVITVKKSEPSQFDEDDFLF